MLDLSLSDAWSSEPQLAGFVAWAVQAGEYEALCREALANVFHAINGLLPADLGRDTALNLMTLAELAGQPDAFAYFYQLYELLCRAMAALILS